ILVRNLETTSEVDEVQLWEMDRHIEHDFEASEKNIYVLDLTTRVHVQSFHLKACRLDDAFDMPHLVNGDTEFAIDMAGGNLVIPARFNMRIDPDADGIAVAIPIAKLLKDRDIVDIYIDPELLR